MAVFIENTYISILYTHRSIFSSEKLCICNAAQRELKKNKEKQPLIPQPQNFEWLTINVIKQDTSRVSVVAALREVVPESHRPH